MYVGHYKYHWVVFVGELSLEAEKLAIVIDEEEINQKMILTGGPGMPRP